MTKNKRFPFTEKSIASLPFADIGQVIYRDSKLAGFICVVGKNTKTLTLQSDKRTVTGQRQSSREVLGRWSPNGQGIAVSDARAEAESLRGEHKGKNGKRVPNSTGALTLGDIFERFIEKRRNRAEKPMKDKTERNHRDSFKHLEQAGFHLVPITKLFTEEGNLEIRKRVIKPVRNKEIDYSRGGETAAKNILKLLKALYENTPEARSLESPVERGDVKDKEPNPEGMGSEELADWFQHWATIRNDLTREYILFTLLSSMRPGAQSDAKWEDFNQARKVLEIPNPKGGEKFAFELPLSDSMINCLNRARKMSLILDEATPYIFASPNSKDGQIHLKSNAPKPDWKPKAAGDVKPLNLIEKGRRLRSTWYTQFEKIFPDQSEVRDHFMNHSGDHGRGMGRHYRNNRALIEEHRAIQEQMTTHLLRHCPPQHWHLLGIEAMNDAGESYECELNAA